MKFTGVGASSINYIEEKLIIAKREIESYTPNIIQSVKIATTFAISAVVLVALTRLAHHFPIIDITEAFALGYIFRHPEECSPIAVSMVVAGLIAIQTLTPTYSLVPIPKLVLNATAILIAKQG